MDRTDPLNVNLSLDQCQREESRVGLTKIIRSSHDTFIHIGFHVHLEF